MIQLQLFTTPQNWTKYKIRWRGKTGEAWFVNNAFIYEWGVVSVDDVEIIEQIKVMVWKDCLK